MTIRIERFSGTATEWDGFVRAQHGWTHFHLYGWRTVIDRVFGHECIYLAARDSTGALAGVLPLVRVRSFLFGHYLVSMPFVNYGGPLGSAEAVLSLTGHAVKLALTDDVKLLELRSRVPLPIDLDASHRKLTVVLDLPPGNPEALFKGFESKIRTQIRRSQKDGATVRFGRDQSGEFFRIFSTHMRELGTPTQPRTLFETIADVFPDDTWFGSVYLGGRAIASGCGVRWGNEFEMTWSSADSAYRQIRPTMLMFWAFMERAAAEGLEVFNFGRSSPGSGTHEFKQKWGTRDEPLWWYGFAREESAKTPSPDDGAYSWGPRLWKRLPTPLATAIGPRIVRFIP
jgi:FemAB-related protein (PEP-CTERM system-associated)